MEIATRLQDAGGAGPAPQDFAFTVHPGTRIAGFKQAHESAAPAIPPIGPQAECEQTDARHQQEHDDLL